jgi:hypothetical protein
MFSKIKLKEYMVKTIKTCITESVFDDTKKYIQTLVI